MTIVRNRNKHGAAHPHYLHVRCAGDGLEQIDMLLTDAECDAARARALKNCEDLPKAPSWWKRFLMRFQ